MDSKKPLLGYLRVTASGCSVLSVLADGVLDFLLTPLNPDILFPFNGETMLDICTALHLSTCVAFNIIDATVRPCNAVE
jgi:hypothetical protein